MNVLDFGWSRAWGIMVWRHHEPLAEGIQEAIRIQPGAGRGQCLPRPVSLASNVQTCCRTWRPIGNGVCHPLARTDAGRECSHEVMRISFKSVDLCIATAGSLRTQTRLQFRCESCMRCCLCSMMGYIHKVRYLVGLPV